MGVTVLVSSRKDNKGKVLLQIRILREGTGQSSETNTLIFSPVE